MKYKEASDHLSQSLQQIYDERESANIADRVLEHLTGKKKWQRQLDNHFLSPDQELKLGEITRQLLTNKPMQYVLNEAWFYGLKFKLNENVLIPRPETEELVDLIIKENRHRDISIIDIGTGSGCMAISLQKNLPDSQVTGIDISEEALKTAKENATANRTDVQFLQVDFLNENSWNALGKYDIIASNPPYIPKNEQSLLAKNVVNFEPDIALFVEENDPLLFYRKIDLFSRNHLTHGGKVYVEVHEDYAHEVAALFLENNNKDVQVRKDIYDKNRMISYFR